MWKFRTEAVQFLFWEYINRIFLAVCAANIDSIKLKYYITLNSLCTCHSKNPPNPTGDESILAPRFAAELCHQSVPVNKYL